MPVVKLSDGKHYGWKEENGELSVYEVVFQKKAILTMELVREMVVETRKQAIAEVLSKSIAPKAEE